MTLRVGSLFSGIGGFDLAFERVGAQMLWQSEIDKPARRVLRARFAEMELHGDIADIDPATLAAVDVVVGGSPCQDLSIAGRGAGLAGERSGLFYEFARIAAELDPDWMLFENVPHLLSISYGRDFGAVLAYFTGLHPETPARGWRNSGVCVGPWRTAVWRVLDAQFYGLAQRRKRLFVVVHTGDWRAPVRVLLEPEGVRGHPPTRGRTRENVAALTATGVGTCGADDNQAQAGHLIAGTASAKWAKGSGGPAGDETQNIVTHTLTADGHDASEDGSGRGVPLVVTDDVSATVTATSGRSRGAAGADQSLVAFNWQSGGDGRLGESEEIASAAQASQTPAVAYQCHGTSVGEMGALRRGNGSVTGGVPFIAAFDLQQVTSVPNRQRIDGDCPAPTVHSLGGPPAIIETTDASVAFSCKDSGQDAGDIAPTLRAMGHDASHANGGGQLAIAHDAPPSDSVIAFAVRGRDGGALPEASGEIAPAQRTPAGGSSHTAVAMSLPISSRVITDDLAPTLQAQSSEARGGAESPKVLVDPPDGAETIVRRLTPLEVSRLQGFPDTWLFDLNLSDAAKYRALGNAVAVPVVEWIARRLVAEIEGRLACS